jgi:hypothetical protein
MATDSLIDCAMVDRWIEFGRKAALPGHDRGLLSEGREDRIYFMFRSVEEVRKMLPNASPEEARARRASFFQPIHKARRRLGQGVHDRSEAYVFAGGELSEYDREGIARHLPLHAQSIAVAEKVVGPGEVWDVSLRGDRWNCDERDELYTAVNVGRLILHPGAAVVVHGNVVSLLCQEYICLGRAEEFQILIFPTPCSVDAGRGPHHGVRGERGENGRPGENAEAVRAEPQMLGYQLRGEMPTGDGAGGNGRDGEDGADGGDGRNGGMCYLAELTFRAVSGPLAVYSRAGEGGAGGNGGDGGNGSDGGRGRDGYPLFTGMLLPGVGGNGGSGGSGGRGGRGGNGGISSNIYISVPAACESRVRCFSEASTAGRGGAGADGGEPGAGGAGGIAHHFPSPVANGARGSLGHPGGRGIHGRSGRSRSGAVFFLNNRIVESSRVAANPVSVQPESKETLRCTTNSASTNGPHCLVTTPRN